MTDRTSSSLPLVWDRFVRIFHWTLVLCVLSNFFVFDDGKDVHQWTGYLAVCLVVMRIIWGFVGTKHARFSDFFPTPTRIIHHIQALKSGVREEHAGHNPLGALMMLTLISVVLCLGITGWMQTLDAFWGEEWLQEIHEFIANTLIALATVHAAAAIVMGRLEKTRLIRAMFTGRKERW